MERPGMMIYLNIWERLQRRLSYEQLGRLLAAMLDVLGGRQPQPLDDDPALALAFDMVNDMQERDAERYNAIVEKRREAGRKGGRKRQQNIEQMQAGAGKVKQNKPNTTPITTPTPIPITNTNTNTNSNSLSESPEACDAQSDWLEDDALFAVPAGDERETAGVFSEDAEDERNTSAASHDGIMSAVLARDESEVSTSRGRRTNDAVPSGYERETAPVFSEDAEDEGSANAASHGGQTDSVSAGMERETVPVGHEDAEDERNGKHASHGGTMSAVSAEDKLTVSTSRGNRTNRAVSARDARETAGVGHEDEQRVTAAHDRKAEDRKASHEEDLAFFDAQWNEMLRETYGRMRPGAVQETRPFESTNMTAGANPAAQGASQSRSTPSAQDVLEYARCARLSADRTQAERFIAEQSASDWRDSNGAPIRDWRRWFTGWLARQTAHGGSRAVPTSMQYAMRTYTPEELARIGTEYMEMELEDA